ncbi:hypothetical protein HBH50_180790 [Parastagonospora nodorum]|nr:hypothetical protein HBH50_180790 [Parastagonospora nodorum]KAH4087366.1 hypothetical protein HBH48_131100 [Parastagonospora nodorum]KAH6427742.1 hypothetical protein HBI14_049670 [Parastagonospora nodorum]
MILEWTPCRTDRTRAGMMFVRRNGLLRHASAASESIRWSSWLVGTPPLHDFRRLLSGNQRLRVHHSTSISLMFRVADAASALLDFCQSLLELVTLRDVSRLPGNHAYGLCQSQTSPRRSRGTDSLCCTNLRQDLLEDLVCGHAQTERTLPQRRTHPMARRPASWTRVVMVVV